MSFFFVVIIILTRYRVIITTRDHLWNTQINMLAKRAGINQSTLDNIVRGLTKDPRVSTLHKVALAFNMTLAEFLDFPELNDFAFEDDLDK